MSGNPGGRPKEVAEVKALARIHTVEAINTLVGIMRSGKSDNARIAAANSLLDRGYGKPAMVLSGDDGAIVVRLEDRLRDARERIKNSA